MQICKFGQKNNTLCSYKGVSSNIYCLTITTNNGGISTITLNNNKLIIDINYGIEPHNYLNYYNETAI